MKIAIGCDHIVTDIKDRVVLHLKSQGHDLYDCGTFDFERTHYPIFGKKVAELVAQKSCDLGIVICGTGVGITNSANKVPGIRAALVGDVAAAKHAKETLDANIIGLGGRVTGFGAMCEIIEVFLTTEFNNTQENIANIARITSVDGNRLASNIFDPFLNKWDEGGYND